MRTRAADTRAADTRLGGLSALGQPPVPWRLSGAVGTWAAPRTPVRPLQMAASERGRVPRRDAQDGSPRGCACLEGSCALSAPRESWTSVGRL
eukprot:CAMPEP_0183373224 /NCGR_PEP_ID=MMETSP0164_2-20130417/110820_1 /TAXON_ID=221442 /ORGANISM="Coccolithus pelagicus ssp braarudi, Strain PLY182g" /LENGTH=92 /DNA_ID=CAMNT_0025550075 /DNA_START=23 /DNA_END=298 /DNA_ORIENTATION=-